MTSILQDLRYALRMMKKSPGFTAIAVVTLALGIGATTMIFSALDCILLEPIPFKDPHHLVAVFIHDPTQPKGNGRRFFRMPELMDYREQNHSLQDMAGINGVDVLYASGKETELFTGGWVTPNSFEFLGVPPLLGRWITEDDAKPGAPPVFAMSDRLWAKQFNRDPKILNTVMTLNGEQRTLVAIMPPRFLFGGADVYMPVAWSHTDVLNKQIANAPMYFGTFGRLKPGVTLRQTTADFDVIARRLSGVYPKDYPPKFTIVTTTFADAASGNWAGMLYTLLAAVCLLMLIACSNVANLLLARATAREKEIAIRASLGANRARIVRQLLVETFLLSAAGCIVGCGLAYAGMKEIETAIPVGTLAPEVVIKLSSQALLFAIGIALLTTLLVGLAPAIHAMRGDLHSKLMGSGKGAGTGLSHGRLRSALVVFEVALSVLLLAGAGLMMRSLVALTHVELGFNPANILIARVVLPQGRYDTAQQKRAFFQPLLQRIAALPGVVAATETTSLPPLGAISYEVTVPGKSHSDQWNASLDLASEGDFQTLGMQLLRGRLLSVDDVESARQVAVINQTMAQKYFAGSDPIGQTIKFNIFDRFPDAPHDAYFQIIGIVRDVRNQGIRDSINPGAYVPYTITGAFSRLIMARTVRDPLLMLPSIRDEIASIDSSVPLTFTGSVEGYLQQYLYSGPEFGLVTMSAFAGIGLVLVTIGVFSVMAYSVSLQTHDIGIRMTLGAQQSDVLRMVIKNGLKLIAAGILLGLVASFALTRVIASQIWGVPPADPLTFAVVVVVVFIVGLAACFSPARRATKVDPMIALRYE